MPPGRLCRLLTGASGEEERMVFRVGIIRGSPGSSRPSEPALCVFDKCPHESLIKMNNCASISSQPLPTIQQRSFVVYARICIAVFQQRCDKTSAHGTPPGCFEDVELLAKNFPALVSSVTGFAVRSEKTAGLCRVQFVGKARNSAQNRGNGEVTCPKSA